MATLPQRLDALPILDSLQRVENPLATGWKTAGLTSLGQATASGWTTTANGTSAGAIWTGSATAGIEVALAITLAVLPDTNGQHIEFGWHPGGAPGEGFLDLKRVSATKVAATIATAAGSVSGEKTWAVGDRWALAYVGGKLLALRKSAAGIWEVQLEVAVAVTVAAAEYFLAFYTSTTTVPRVVDFAAGLVGGPVPGSCSLLGVGR